MSMEELAELIPIKAGPGGAKKPKMRIEPDTIDASDGLDTLANLAILGEGEALPSQPTTKHPRHRPGCSCIVCIQPPSGKGPKHKQTCTCNVCMTVRRRFRTLMLRREKRQPKDTDSARKKEAGQSSEAVSQTGSGPPATSASSSPQKADANADGTEDMAVDHKMTSSPVKNHIDLNIQPERDDEQSPKSDAAGAARLLRDNQT
uniref:B3 domain-containing transcription factor VAL3 n=1 Tax=Arundo donax TaxID=35708 RepID=A0A0A9GAX1_ARUDO